ncbi:MAG: relaxase/mobilization nuclease domain-containing protein, partial [Wenzhouxiangellaceae bacterium]
ADLHGAFAEWELQADTRTKCEKYLFSLSINPDQEQGRLTRAQYADYIDRTEKALGLSGQPRAVIYHVKDGREHCHVVWSRIDTDAGKAVQLSFWKQKTMMVTRRFARDHDLALPKGYDPDRERTGKSKQASQYEMNQQRMTGLTKAERMEAITEAWRQSDSPKAFVAALEELGYVLATGKQPYVLVDINGDTNALPKLIDDKRVRKRDVQAFLNRSFPPDSLPSVDEAKKAAAAHRKMMEAFLVEEDRADKIAELARMQAHRREAVEQKHSDMQARHRQSRRIFGERQAAERDALKTAYRTEVRQIKADRQARKPTGLAAFLGRVTGIELVRRKIHAYQDRKRHQAFLAEKAALKRAPTPSFQRTIATTTPSYCTSVPVGCGVGRSPGRTVG